MDYEKIQLKAGLEIHQQLNTSKLFCNCPSQLRDEEPDIKVERFLHAVAGELGEIDAAAAYEASKGKKFIYQAYSDTTCLVELDEEPPRELNRDALFIALQISLLLNAKPFSVTQIMRKVVVDGSNPSGFQRTLLIAKDGYINTKEGRVGVESIALEEDSARIIKKGKNFVVYRVDRLGIPLVEISTAPDIKTPEQAKEVAAKIGEVLRACNVKRGIGTIRQDVNMSVKGKARVEIKGVQELKLIPKVIEKEIERQLKVKVKPEVRKALPDGKTEFLRPLPGKARMYPETDLPLIYITPELIEKVRAELPKLRKEQEKVLERLGVKREIASQIVKKDLLSIFNHLLNTNVEPSLIAKTITITTKNISGHYNIPEKIFTKEIYEKVLRAFQKGKISKDAIKYVLVDVGKGEGVEKAINKYETLSKKDAEKVIKKIVERALKENPELSEKALMGIAMKELKGRVDGKTISEIVREFMKNK